MIEDKLLLVRSDLEILEGQIHTEKAKLEGEVSGFGGHVMIQQPIIGEVREGITMFQGQDNIIVSEAGEISQGIHMQIADMVKKLTTNGSTLINHNKEILQIQDDANIWREAQQSLEHMVKAMDRHIKMLPTKKDIQMHMMSMDDTLQKIQEVSVGLTTHMEAYKVSQSTPHQP